MMKSQKCYDLGVRGLLHLDHLGPKELSSQMSGTLAPFFTNEIIFSTESWDKSNKIMKS